MQRILLVLLLVLHAQKMTVDNDLDLDRELKNGFASLFVHIENHYRPKHLKLVLHASSIAVIAAINSMRLVMILILAPNNPLLPSLDT
jgi:hypothetical protein